jgi:regulator of RNase E activity RraA
VSKQPVSEETLNELRTLDTPTVCNALELTSPERRTIGFTTSPLVCTRPELPPMVGYARTATVSSVAPDTDKGSAARDKRDGYYEYMGAGSGPGITVIQDVDGEKRGFGAWWGEVNSNIHKGLGSLGLITDGSVRDLPDIAPGFQMLAGSVGPSHAWVHVEEYECEVEIFGMKVSPGDLIHADQHGAVVIPIDVADKVKAAAETIAKNEGVIIKAAQQPGFGIEQLREAWKDLEEIH